MSIRWIARELYRLQQEVERIETLLESEAPEHREALTNRLQKARSERDHMRKILDGQKG